MPRIKRTKKGYLVDAYVGGKRVRKVLPTRDAAKQHIADKTQKATDEKYFGVTPEEFGTFNELVAWYVEHPKVKRKKGYDRELWRIKRLKDFFGEMRLEDIAAEDIEHFVTQQLNTINQKGTFNKPGTVNREIVLAKHIFNLAVDAGKTRHNPTKKVRQLDGEEERERYLTDEEWAKYYEHCTGWFKPVAQCLYTTAMRLGEVRHLTWDKVDRKAGFIRLKADDTKTSRARRIPISPDLDETLQTLPRSLSGYVFTRNGGPLPEHLSYYNGQTCKGAGIRNFRLHDFRHTAIKNWVDSGANIFTVQAASGHKDINMLRRYYTVTDDNLREMAEKSMVSLRSEKKTRIG